MKELTTEQKAERYVQTLERVKAMIKVAANQDETIDFVNTIFPELKESEDERIREEITEFLKKASGGFLDTTIQCKTFGKWFAWLEKQGEKKETDKVKPKFNAGDWVVISTSDGEKVVQIDSIEYFKSGELRYITSEGRWFGNGTEAHLWTIQDAKDGDVLEGSKGDVILMFRGIGNTAWHDVIDFHCYYNSYRGDFIVQEGLGHWGDTENSQLKPAAKEQRDLLFRKMHEAGYMWDSESKQLLSLKAEPSVEQNSAQSEEDEHRLKDVIYFLDTAKKHYASTVELDACIDWLKSLKQRIVG